MKNETDTVQSVENASNYLTLGEAAKLTGKSKPAISAALKSGKLSHAGKTVAGAYKIERSELLRVYPAIDQEEQEANSQSLPPDNTVMELLRDTLEHERRDRQTEREALQDTISDLRERLTRAELQLQDHREKPGRRWWPFG